MAIGALALAANMALAQHAVAQGTTVADDATGKRLHAFVQVGSGLVEFAHAEVGVFLTARLTLEAMAAWDGVFYSRYGGGLMYSFGHAPEGMTPRKALLVGARLMLNSTASFDSGGDELSSYVLVPVGYGYRGDSGFYLRATLAPVITRERSNGTSNGGPIEHHWAVGGPMLDVSVGLAY